MIKKNFKTVLVKIIIICVVITVMKDFLVDDTAYSIIPVGLEDNRYCCLAGCPSLDPVEAYKSSHDHRLIW